MTRSIPWAPRESVPLVVVIALLAPGQGAQTPGMLTPWLTTPDTREQVERWSEVAGLDLVALGSTAAAEEIKDTAAAQPLIVALSLLAAERMGEQVELPLQTPVAGHSVGELAAAAIAGALSPDDAVALAAVRGKEMAAACAAEPTGMSAVMLGDEDEVLARLSELGVEPANRNGANQIVAAGPLSALEKLAAEPPAGAKVRALPVAGAFHTRFMAPARDALASYVQRLTFSDPQRPLLSNADGAVVTSGQELARRLVEQVTVPVRWDACVATLADMRVGASVELPPGKTLTGLVRRQLKGVATLPLTSPEELEKLAPLFAEHAASEEEA